MSAPLCLCPTFNLSVRLNEWMTALGCSNTFPCWYTTSSPSHPWQDSALPRHAWLMTCRHAAKPLYRPTVAHQASPCFRHTLLTRSAAMQQTKTHMKHTQRNTHTRAAYEQNSRETRHREQTMESRATSTRADTGERERKREKEREKERLGWLKEKLTG